MFGWWAAAFVVQWVLLAVLALVVVALARQIGVLHLRVSPLGALESDDEGPPLGEIPETRTARGHEGAPTLVGGPGPRRLLAFVSPTCPICEQLLPSVPAAASAAGLVAQVVSDPELEVAYRVPGVPFVVILDEAGVVRSKGTVNSLEQIEGLIDTARRRISEAEDLRAS
ncbi:MAG: thioredoxin family protein [Actinomycetota bacterium]